VKTWDVIIIGGGIIGLSLAIALRKRGATVLVVERGEPGREASHAAGGMLVDSPLETPIALKKRGATVLVVERGEPGREASHAAGGMLVDSILETPPILQALATASAQMYPEFTHEIELESGMKVDLRDQGTVLFLSPEHAEQHAEFAASHPLPNPLAELEPAIAGQCFPALYLKERSVDPRALSAAAWKAAKHRGVDFSSGDEVTAVTLSDGHATGVQTVKTAFRAAKVVNCAGAWSGQIQVRSGGVSPRAFPTRPVKGQMLCLIMPSRTLLKHVVRSPELPVRQVKLSLRA
jgi:glycine oxidase